MKYRPHKYRIAERHDFSIGTCTIYAALRNKRAVYVMGRAISGPVNILLPFWANQSVYKHPKPHPEFVIKASLPDSKLCMAIYGPVHKKSHHSRFALVDLETARVWYIKRNKWHSMESNSDAYQEMRLIKEVQKGKLRRGLIEEGISIFEEWLSEQFR